MSNILPTTANSGFVGFAGEDGMYVARPFKTVARTTISMTNFMIKMAVDKNTSTRFFHALTKYPSWESFTINPYREVEEIQCAQYESSSAGKPSTFTSPIIYPIRGLGILDTSPDVEDVWIAGKLNNVFMDDTINVEDGTTGYIMSKDSERIIVVSTHNTPEGMCNTVVKKIDARPWSSKLRNSLV